MRKQVPHTAPSLPVDKRYGSRYPLGLHKEAIAILLWSDRQRTLKTQPRAVYKGMIQQNRHQSRENINNLLYPEQVKALIEFIYEGKSVKLLRITPQTGRSGNSAPWIYWQSEVTNQCWATFLPLELLQRFFWDWLEKIKVIFLSMNRRNPINKVIYTLVSEGETVHHVGYGWVTITQKYITQDKWLPKFTINQDGKLIEDVEPCMIEVF